MAVSADHAVAYTIGSIFKHIIDCVFKHVYSAGSIQFWTDFWTVLPVLKPIWYDGIRNFIVNRQTVYPFKLIN